MTNKEAIENIKWYRDNCDGDFPSSILQAFDLAIKALETVDQAHNSLLNEEESERLLDLIGDDTGLHERAVSDLNDTVADILRKCKRGEEQ